VRELRNAGIEVESIFDLVNSRRSYKEAIPVLLRVLPTLEDSWIKEGVVRAIAVPGAPEDVARVLVREFKNIAPDAPPAQQQLKWAIGNTLSIVAQDHHLDLIAQLVREKVHGKAREMLAAALANMKDPRAIDILLELLDDDVVAGHAVMALGRLKAKKAERALERFLTNPNPWIREQAERALGRIRKVK